MKKMLTEPVLSWSSQVKQYPRLGAPGIQHFAGVIKNSPLPPVDCYLWRGEDGLVHGIANYYSVDYPPFEKAGNINIFVQSGWKRQGIGTALFEWCQRIHGPINLDQQTYSPEGLAWLNARDKVSNASD